jgi:phosphatidylethanolamine/phosphatidyl-N-methylethanolamine N-methyltransferase
MFELRDHVEFFRQFRRRFETTGAVTPSSRFLAAAMTGPLRRRERPVRILEVGPGTGAVTRRIVRLLRPEDRLDLVELNESFAGLLRQRFVCDPQYARVAECAQVHVLPLQEYQTETPYDFIISGLPLNNFPADLVRQIFDCYFRLLAPGGVLSYFEYMYVRPMRKMVARGPEKQRLTALDAIIGPVLSQHRFRQSWVFVNMPPAWVQHLQREPCATASGR